MIGKGTALSRAESTTTGVPGTAEAAPLQKQNPGTVKEDHCSRAIFFQNLALLRLDWLDHHELAHLTAVLEHDLPSDFCEEGVVFPAPDVKPRFHPRAALTHDDRAAGDNLSAECLESKPLRIRVAAVS